MKTVGFIPIRKGSKGIINKNKKKMVGRPLFCWVLKEAIFSKLDEVYVFTDDTSVVRFIEKEYHWTDKVHVIVRGSENADDLASTESAMIEFSKRIDFKFDVLCLLQATSPFTINIDINNCIDKIVEESYNSALTVVNSHRFIWNSNGEPVNYNMFKRPRRQDFDGLLIENGAVYCTTKKAFLESENRISGTIATVRMCEESLTEIDSSADWVIVEQLLIQRLKEKRAPKRITHFVLDVDGVFTKGTISYTAEGEHTKTFDMRDGMGLEILRQDAVKVMVMTSEDSPLVAARMKKLNIEDVFLGVKDKYAFLADLREKRNLDLEEMAYIGDDVNDLANLCSVGWSFVPGNGTEHVKPYADILLKSNSGEGAIREACEWILKYNKRF
ncbi:cytidylyltransferase family protein [Formosa agariphila KMM 3901]|uniref:N-acylneuraminate cytidylyltransferase n=1 Tax=Formosa agariphila (strain DSM 15362 / KCTC 12365 / LMG 23005 / KMM 3901 / M-2Alg 35-1) TaxID=1347342 RepID=T2KMQ7_FORAG|nr:acylneuraminate cytidylyltransferase [Formosa agariphila]CDF80030.1 cytidylyltransferase family protein [Formosa agariphila KMM 3901]